MRSSALLLLAGLLFAPGLSLPLPSGQQQTGSHRYGLLFNIRLPSEQLALKEKATLGCLLKASDSELFYAEWSLDGKPLPVGPSPTVKPMEESQEKYHYHSNMTISGQQWNSADTYSCVVGQNALLLQTTQTPTVSSTEPVESSAPSGYLHPLHHEEILLPQKFLTFGCFFEMSDGSYSIFSELNIPEAHWNFGDTLSCTYVNKGHVTKSPQRTVENPQGQK